MISMCNETHVPTCGFDSPIEHHILFANDCQLETNERCTHSLHLFLSHFGSDISNHFHDEAAFSRIFKVFDNMLLFKREHAHDLTYQSYLFCPAQSHVSHCASFLLGLVLEVLLGGPATGRSARHQNRFVACSCASTTMVSPPPSLSMCISQCRSSSPGAPS